MLPFREIQVIDSLKNEMNVAAYEDQLARTPPINIARPFDGYRDLKQNLEKCGVVCRKNITTDTSANQNSTDYDRRTEASYSVMSADVSEYFGDQKDLIIINADFPRTYKRSAFGIKLSDEQITKR